MFSIYVRTAERRSYPQDDVLDSAAMRDCFQICAAKNKVPWLFCFALLAGAGFAQVAAPPAPIDNAPFSSSTPKSSAVVPATPSSFGDSSMRLGIGDLIHVNVYGVPDLDTRTRVSSNGDIYLPLINYVHVDGLTQDEVEKVLEKRVEDGGFVRNAHVQVSIEENTSEVVSVLGEVARPGLYPVLGEQMLFNLISAAGGLSDRAGQTITITHRAQPQKPQTVTISRNLEDHPQSNVRIYPGDSVMVRRADVVYIVGDVAHPSGFLMDNSGHLTVLQALALAGGTTSSAKLNGTRIIRKQAAGVTEISVPLKNMLRAKATDLALEANDILFVPTSARKIIGTRTADTALQLASAATIIAIRP